MSIVLKSTNITTTTDIAKKNYHRQEDRNGDGKDLRKRVNK
jgi:hypothetical protein